MSKFNPDIEKAIEKGKSLGFTVIQSTRSTLLLDLDTPESVAQFNDVLPLVKEFLKVKEVLSWESEHGNQHRLIYLDDDLHVLTRIALQAVLGSDPKREVFAIERIKAGITEPSLLFQPVGITIKSDALVDIPF